MNHKQYRATFLLITAGLALVAAYPMIAMIVTVPDSSDKFTEMWLLGPEQTTTNYPFNVSIGETYKIFVSLANHMNSSEYYRIYVKFGNLTQLNLDGAAPASLPPLYEFQVFVGDEASWEAPITFEFQNVSIESEVPADDNTTTQLPIEDSILSVGNIIINGIAFPVDASTSWNSEYNGFHFLLSFELWRYDMTTKSFSFDNRVVGLPLNMTASQ